MIIRPCCLMLVLGLSLFNAAAVASEPSSVTDRIAATLDQLEKDGNFPAARNVLGALFDQVAIHSPLSQPDDFRQAALAVRLVQQLALADSEIRMDLLKLLRANPRLAQAMCFSIKPEHQRPQQALAILHRAQARAVTEMRNNRTTCSKGGRQAGQLARYIFVGQPMEAIAANVVTVGHLKRNAVGRSIGRHGTMKRRIKDRNHGDTVAQEGACGSDAGQTRRIM
jgi:hypothetical protein